MGYMHIGSSLKCSITFNVGVMDPRDHGDTFKYTVPHEALQKYLINVCQTYAPEHFPSNIDFHYYFNEGRIGTKLQMNTGCLSFDTHTHTQPYPTLPTLPYPTLPYTTHAHTHLF